jgi:putative effector of murein hydrolase LrgA (UPF0299 family)
MALNANSSAQGLKGFAWLLALQTAGELLVRVTGLPMPGPVVGMALLLLALRWPSVRSSVAGSAICPFFLCPWGWGSLPI